MLTLIRLCLYLVFITLLSACTKKELSIEGGGVRSITGSISNFSSLSSAAAKISNQQKIGSLSSGCSSAEASLYQLDSNGDVSGTALATGPVDSDGNFTISIKDLGLNIKSNSIRYSIVISGCDQELSSPVTDFKNQKISWGSSLVSEVSRIDNTASAYDDIAADELNEFLLRLYDFSSTDYDSTYSNILANADLLAQFHSLFGRPLHEIQNSKPKIKSTNIQLVLLEGFASNYSVVAKHWSSSYNIAYEWSLGGVVLSTNSSFTYTPSKNSQGNKALILKVGKNNGAGIIDTTKPFLLVNYSVTILNNYPATAPTMNLVGASTTNSNNVSVSINTGALMSLCDTFSSFIILDGAVTPTASQIDQTCTTAGSQTYVVNITGEGVHSLRIWILDSSGEITQSPQILTVILDQSPPVLQSVSINDNATYAGTTILNVKVNVADYISSSSPIYIRLAAANAATGECQSEYSNNNWIAWTNASANYSFAASPSDGIKKVCVWAKDNFSNVSVISSPSSGTLGINQDTIIYETGNAPLISNFNVYNPSNGSKIFTSTSQPIQIEWTISDVEGLDNNPIAISYTTDNSNWKDLITNGLTSTTSNITWIGGLTGNPISTTSSYSSFNAPTTAFFRLRAVARDQAGNTSIVSYSPVLNVVGWSVYAGTIDDGIGGTAKSVRLRHGQAAISKFAINPLNNDIYTLSSGVGVLKLSAQTGLVTIAIPNSSTTSMPTDGSAINSSHRIRVYSSSGLTIDSNGYLYLHDDWSSNINSKLVYQINTNTNPMTSRLYIGGGTGISTTTDPTQAYYSAGLTFDEDNSLYYWVNCLPGTDANTHLKARLMKATQNSVTKQVQLITPIAGDCTSSGNPTSGQPALNQPITANHTSIALGGMTVWGQGNNIYFGMYGLPTYKIINGLIYTTSLPAYNTGMFYRANLNKLWLSFSAGVYEAAPSLSGANGESYSEVVNSSGTSLSCREDGIDASQTCVTIANNFSQTNQGTMLFIDGPLINSSMPYRIRYLDDSNKVQTIMGSKPMYGNGLSALLSRGIFSGIFYKPATLGGATALTAFPEGLYFVDSSGPTFGHIDPITKTLSILLGNQRGAGAITSAGTISSGMTMGPNYSFVNGRLLTFDDNGLPWLGSSGKIYSIDSNKTILQRTGFTSALWNSSADDSIVSNLSLGVNGGEANLNIHNNISFMGGNYYSLPGYNLQPSIKAFNFGLSDIGDVLAGKIKNIIGNHLTNGFSIDSALDSPANSVLTKNKTLDSFCRSHNTPCRIQFDSNTNKLYFSERDKLRYINDPTQIASSTLNTQLILSAGQSFINFIISLDGTKIFYIRENGRLYCHNISGVEPKCNNTTFFNPTGAMTFTVTSGPNQMTWKSDTELLLSDYSGQIFLFEFVPTP
jgi:hypothetical protein